MLLGGDELGRTQRGNNNAYCQDNELSWYDWEHVDEPLLEFTRRLIRLRREHPVVRRRGWVQGRPIHGGGVSDIGWFRPDGREMSDEDWQAGFVKSLGVFLNGEGLTAPDRQGNPVVDDSFLVLFNAHHEPLTFRVPDREWGRRWITVLDTRDEMPREGQAPHDAGADVDVEARSVVVLRRAG
jgi:isoamylase